MEKAQRFKKNCLVRYDEGDDVASLIKETPKLKGIYAESFYRSVKNNEFDEAKNAYLNDCRRVYKKVIGSQV